MRASSNSARSATLTEAKAPREPRDAVTVALLSAVLTLAALAFCSQHQLLLLYGDAVAHLHIARRIFDARSPGFRQLGSVWLPLPHLLLIPFVQKMSWWQSGVPAAIPSMACYVAACVGLYRLALCFVRHSIAWLAVAFFALNPGLLYFSTTAMTEPLFLAEMIWAALLVALLARRSQAGKAEGLGRLLLGAALVLVCAVFTRYDGWIYAAAAWCVASWIVLKRRNLRERLTGIWLLASVLVVMAPLLWIAYNAKQFHDPFDFLRGPYSARAIEARTSPTGAGHYMEYHRPVVATLYFLKAAELGAVVPYATQLIFFLSLAGTAFLWLRRRDAALAAASLLWLPLPFYTYSIAYGSVPLFIPVWFPHSWYNTRYGMEMLPAFALFGTAALEGLATWRPSFARARFAPEEWERWITPVAAALILANSILLLRAGPLVFQEAVVNARTRIPFERTLANWLRVLPPDKTLLMSVSDHVGAVQQAGIPLRDIINEGDYYEWNAALKDPSAKADYVVALDGDAVAKAVTVHPRGLTLLQIICSTGQPCARVYATKNPVPGSSAEKL